MARTVYEFETSPRKLEPNYKSQKKKKGLEVKKTAPRQAPHISKEEKRKQVILDTDIVKKLFEYKTMKTFEDKLYEFVVTRAEKFAITQIVKKLKLNDHEKIRLIEEYTGYKV